MDKLLVIMMGFLLGVAILGTVYGGLSREMVGFLWVTTVIVEVLAYGVLRKVR